MTERRIEVKPASPMSDGVPDSEKTPTPMVTSPLSIKKSRQAKHAAAPPFGSTAPLPGRNSKLRAPPRTAPVVHATENARRGMAPNPMWELAESAHTKSPPTHAFVTQAKTPQAGVAAEMRANAAPELEVDELKAVTHIRSKESWWQTALNTVGQLGKTTMPSDVPANEAEDEKDKGKSAGAATDKQNKEAEPVKQTMMRDDDVEALVNYCLYLGADVNEHPELVPLVAQMFWQPLPDDWKPYSTDKDSEHGPGYTYYWNSKTGRTQWVHPNEDQHVRVLEKKVRKVIPGTRIWFHRNDEMRNSQIYTLFHEQTKHLPEKRPLLRSAEVGSEFSNGVIDCPMKDNFPQLHLTVLTAFTSYFQIQKYDDVSMWGAFLIKLAALCPIPPSWTFNYDEDLCEAVYVRGDHFCIKRHPMDAFFSVMLDLLFRRHIVWRMKGGEQRLQDYFAANAHAKPQSPRDKKASVIPALNSSVMSMLSQETIPLAPVTPTAPLPPDVDRPAVPVIPSPLNAKGDLALKCQFGDKRPKIPPRPPLTPSPEYHVNRSQQDMALLRGHVGVKGVAMTSPPSLKADDKRTYRCEESEAALESPTHLPPPPPPPLRHLPRKDDETTASGSAARKDTSASSSEQKEGTVAPQRHQAPPAGTPDARASGPEASKGRNSKHRKVRAVTKAPELCAVESAERTMPSVEQRSRRLAENNSQSSAPREKRASPETSPRPLPSSQQRQDASDALPSIQKEKDASPRETSPLPPGRSERREGSCAQSSIPEDKYVSPEAPPLPPTSSQQRQDYGDAPSSVQRVKNASPPEISLVPPSSSQRRERDGGAQSSILAEKHASPETPPLPATSSQQRQDYGDAPSSVQEEKNAPPPEISPLPPSSSQRRERDGGARSSIPQGKDVSPETSAVPSSEREKIASPETSSLPSRSSQSQKGDDGVHSNIPRRKDMPPAGTPPLPSSSSQQQKDDGDAQSDAPQESNASPLETSPLPSSRSQRRKGDSDAQSSTLREENASPPETLPVPLSRAQQRRDHSDVLLSGTPGKSLPFPEMLPLPPSCSQKCKDDGDVQPSVPRAEDAYPLETPLVSVSSSLRPEESGVAQPSVPRKNSTPPAETLPPAPPAPLPSPPLTDAWQKRDEESPSGECDDLTSSHTTGDHGVDSYSREYEKHASRASTSPTMPSTDAKPVGRREATDEEESSTALHNQAAEHVHPEIEQEIQTPPSVSVRAPVLEFPVPPSPPQSMEERAGVASEFLPACPPPPPPLVNFTNRSSEAKRNTSSPEPSAPVVDTTSQRRKDDGCDHAVAAGGWEKKQPPPRAVRERESTNARSQAKIREVKLEQEDRKVELSLLSVPAVSMPPPLLSTSDTCKEQPNAAQNEATQVVRGEPTSTPSAVAENRADRASEDFPEAQNASSAPPLTTSTVLTLNQDTTTSRPSSSTTQDVPPTKDKDPDSVLASVLAWTAQLRMAPDNEVLGILQALQQVEMTIEILQESKVGVATQRFKTHEIPAVQECVKELRMEWKNVILQKQKKQEGSHKMPAPHYCEPAPPTAADCDVDNEHAVPVRLRFEGKHQSTRVNSQAIQWLCRLFLEQREALYDVLVDRTNTEEADRIRGHLDVVRFRSLLTEAFEEGHHKPLQSFMKRFAGTTLTSTLCSVTTGEKWWVTIVEKIDAKKDTAAEDWVRKDLPRLLADIGQCLGEIRKTPVAEVPFTLSERAAASSPHRVSPSMSIPPPHLTPPTAPPSSEVHTDAPFKLPTSLPKRPLAKPGFPTPLPATAPARTPPTAAPVRKQPATASPTSSASPSHPKQRVAAPPQLSPVISTDEEDDDSDVSLGGVARAMGLCEPPRPPLQGDDHAPGSRRDTASPPLASTGTPADDDVRTPPLPPSPHGGMDVVPLDPILWGKLDAYAGGAFDNLGSALEYYLPGASICTRGTLQQMTDGELLICQRMMDALTNEINQQLLASFKDRDELHSDIQHRIQYANMLYARANKTAFTVGLI